MSLFRRGPDPNGERDRWLPVLSQAQAAELARLARAAVAERGREATYRDAALTLDDGTTLGLYNLSTVVAQAPYKQWPRLVGEHFNAMLAPRDNVDLQALLPRLRLAADIPMPLEYHVPSPLPGVLTVLASDLPTTVVELFAVPAEFPSVDAALSIAYANAADLPAPEHIVTPLPDHPEILIHSSPWPGCHPPTTTSPQLLASIAVKPPSKKESHGCSRRCTPHVSAADAGARASRPSDPPGTYYRT